VYVTLYGGTSPDLGIRQVGILRRALEANTTLDPTQDRVRVTILGRPHARPLFLDAFFEVVPLDERHPDALERSRRGEAVFPEGDEVIRRYESPRLGAEVVLNNVLSARAGFERDPAAFERILVEILRQRRDDRSPDA